MNFRCGGHLRLRRIIGKVCSSWFPHLSQSAGEFHAAAPHCGAFFRVLDLAGTETYVGALDECASREDGRRNRISVCHSFARSTIRVSSTFAPRIILESNYCRRNRRWLSRRETPARQYISPTTSSLPYHPRMRQRIYPRDNFHIHVPNERTHRIVCRCPRDCAAGSLLLS
jgi:hypothetical protein